MKCYVRKMTKMGEKMACLCEKNGEKTAKMKQKYVKNGQKGGLLPHCHFVVITRIQLIINNIKAQ